MSGSDFIILSPRTIEAVSTKLDDEGGKILVGEPGSHSHPGSATNVQITLFSEKGLSINSSRAYLSAPRGSDGRGWQTGWEDDRNWRLRKPLALTRSSLVNRARNFLQVLPLSNGFQFEIHFQPVVGEHLNLETGTTVYIPKDASLLEQAFRFVLVKTLCMLDLPLRQQFQQRHVESIVEYAMRDLRTGETLRRNIAAGQAADALIGLEV